MVTPSLMKGETMTRKHTRFQTCDRHAWLQGETRYRRAEFFCEGGPAHNPDCEGGRCRMWAGTDLFCAEVCEGEYPLTWGGAS
jgi:hypothetical protein